MKDYDKILLEIYMCGFSDELDGKPAKNYKGQLESRAYNLGRVDAIVGDDVRSIDYQTNEQILESIYK
jgi:hypothetical protein